MKRARKGVVPSRRARASTVPAAATKTIARTRSAATAPFAPPPRFRWPDGARCAVMLGFDVDGETTALSEDPTTGETHRRPHVSPDGYYRGKRVVAEKE